MRTLTNVRPVEPAVDDRRETPPAPGARRSRLAPSALIVGLVAIGAALLPMGHAAAQCYPQQVKLLPTGAVGAGQFGASVALSVDGDTALVGASEENSHIGAAYILVRSGATWSQQARLTPAGGVGASQNFGIGVALSADGNTAVVGAMTDNGSIGAAYVLVRSGATWTQQQKLTPTGGVGQGAFGVSVALSADGNTCLVGAFNDNAGAGAVFVFTRSGTVWTQQGPKVTAVGGVSTQFFGSGVALSADGNTAAVGAYADSAGIGAAYVLVRSGAVWTQQGPKITPVGGVGNGNFGRAVALSADGDAAAVGAPNDNVGIGAAYFLTRAGGAWSQTQKMTPIGGTGISQDFGRSLVLSADGNAAIVGADAESGSVGAAYVLGRPGSAWAQLQRLTPTGGVGMGGFGASVALSTDGYTVLVSAPADDANVGAAYVVGVNLRIVFSLQPAGAVILSGGSASFTVAAESGGPLTYRWRRNGSSIDDGPTGWGSTLSGATTPTLTISGATLADSGTAFDCVVSNGCISGRSNPAGLAVAYRCPADFDHSGTLTVPDIFAFLNAWFGGCP